MPMHNDYVIFAMIAGGLLLLFIEFTNMTLV